MRSMRARDLTAGLALLALLAGLAAPALAKTSRRLSHGYDKVWPAAVRYLRVDAGYELIEKDADAGYVLFAIEDEGKTFRGALEVVRRTDDAGRDAVELQVSIEDRPSYMERMLLDRMLRKLSDELGPPPDPPKEKPAPEPEPAPGPAAS